MRNKIIGGVVFALLLCGIGVFGYTRFQAHETVKPTHVLVLSSGTAAGIESKITANPLPILYILCPDEVCRMQAIYAEEAAIYFDGRVHFIQVNPSDLPDMTAAVANLTGQEAYPAYLFVNEDTALAVNGFTSADGIIDFVEQSLSSQVVTLSAANQDAIASSTIPVLYTICTPDLCKLQRPVLEELAEKYDGQVQFVVADAVQFSDMTQAIAQQVGAAVFPMYVFVSPDGTVLPGVGLRSAAQLEMMVQAGLNPSANTDSPDSTQPTTDGAGETGGAAATTASSTPQATATYVPVTNGRGAK